MGAKRQCLNRGGPQPYGIHKNPDEETQQSRKETELLQVFHPITGIDYAANRESIPKGDRQVSLQHSIPFYEVKRMERKRKENTATVLNAVAELFDLPVDVVAGLPHLELIGDRQLYLEHHTGILSYSDGRIDVNTGTGVLRVTGKGLRLVAMTAEELRIGGTILSVEWVGVSEC